MTKISVIMPCYNAADTIESAMNSVLGQTGCDFELIVIDDGSTDESKNLIETKKSQAGEKLVILSIPHTGAYAARNAGMKMAKGEYLYFADADDLVETGALALMAEKMEETGADLLTCGFRQVRRKDGQEKSISAGYGEFKGQEIRSDFTKYDASGSCKVLGSCFNKCFCKDKAAGLSFPALQRNEEEVFIMRYLEVSEKIVNIPDLVYTFYPIDMARSRVRLPENFGEEVHDFLMERLGYAEKFGCSNESSKNWIAKEYWGKMMLALKLCFAADSSMSVQGKEKFGKLCKQLMSDLDLIGTIPANIKSTKLYMLLKFKQVALARALVKKSL